MSAETSFLQVSAGFYVWFLFFLPCPYPFGASQVHTHDQLPELSGVMSIH